MPARPGTGNLVLPVSDPGGAGYEAAPGRPASGRDRSQLETAALAPKLYRRLAGRRTHQLAVVACARELIPFVCAVMCELEEERRARQKAAA